MAPRIQWSTELVSEEFIVPRLEDELIDDLFYQEDEIGEMRHTAFMIECGLEEDPPDGPDVPPVPWGDMLLKQQQEEQAKEQKQSKPLLTDSDSDSDDEDLPPKEKRELPSRSRSTDDIDTLAIELTTSRRVTRRKPPTRSNSTPFELSVSQSSIESPLSPNEGPRKPVRRVSTMASPVTPTRRKAPERRGLTKTRSGTTHGMAAAAARAKKKMNNNDDDASQSPKSPRTLRKLSRTHSGTTREMADAAAKFRKQKKDKEKLGSPSVSERRKSIESIAHKNENKGRPAPLARSLVATKSGTKFGGKNKEDPAVSDDDKDDNSDVDSPKIVYKNGKRTAARRTSTVSKESRLKSRSSTVSSGSNDSDADQKPERRNSSRKGSSIRQYSSTFSSGSNDSDADLKPERRSSSRKGSSFRQYNSMSSEDEDDGFLGHLINNSDDVSVAKSEISISTNGTDVDDSFHSSFRKGKGNLPKSISQPLEMPIRQKSLNVQPLEMPTRQRSMSARGDAMSVSDETYEEGLSSEFSVSKKKLKKKKKKGDGLDDSSNHSTKSTKSLKKKKKKDKDDDVRTPRRTSRKKIISLDSSDDLTDKPYQSMYSPRQSPAKKVEGIYGDHYASPSAIRAKQRLSLSREKSDESSPSIINIGSPGYYGSPAARSVQSEHRRQFTPPPSYSSPTKKSLPYAPDPSKSAFDIARQQEGQTGRPDNYVCTDPLAAIKKKKEQEKAGRRSFGTKRDDKRPDDWLGSGKKAVRSWRVKAKPAGD